jgi:hypothetical protein
MYNNVLSDGRSDCTCDVISTISLYAFVIY